MANLTKAEIAALMTTRWVNDEHENSEPGSPVAYVVRGGRVAVCQRLAKRKLLSWHPYENYSWKTGNTYQGVGAVITSAGRAALRGMVCCITGQVLT